MQPRGRCQKHAREKVETCRQDPPVCEPFFETVGIHFSSDKKISNPRSRSSGARKSLFRRLNPALPLIPSHLKSTPVPNSITAFPGSSRALKTPNQRRHQHPTGCCRRVCCVALIKGCAWTRRCQPAGLIVRLAIFAVQQRKESAAGSRTPFLFPAGDSPGQAQEYHASSRDTFGYC